MTVKLAFVGFGGVGQALVRLLEEKQTMPFQVVAVSDMLKGSLYDPSGLDVQKLLEAGKSGSLDSYQDRQVARGLTSLQTIKDTNADVIVEVTYTNVVTGQPAIDHVRVAFEAGKSVVTTNKGPLALAYKELSELAEANNCYFGFEGTVMSGTPALRLPLETLVGNDIKEIRGILNGTTNYMLTEMEKGLSYEEALKQAQAYGYAEADPTSDVEGYDARYKAVILANVVLGKELAVDDVTCTGITSVTSDDLKEAIKAKKRIRLIASITQEGSEVTAKVQPERIDETDPLATVAGATNAILYDCDLAGPIFLTGAGAGLTETGFSLLIDLVHYQKRFITVN
ncbi:homoserine dehydrogenase [Paenalkalicoccus suaedae]|uniref:Homoserine dehydrogenase n=1 Tax=Paenalkalicoccus suaedae TaxID=2592382 RepID=A0A859FIP3_9BACI|nr:homoserine dehydrogenase [Paenalkalicoccus suaedae]QKS72146.1 homoserine dehydrogenase [Paenalkalicoccus suaedae]